MSERRVGGGSHGASRPPGPIRASQRDAAFPPAPAHGVERSRQRCNSDYYEFSGAIGVHWNAAGARMGAQARQAVSRGCGR